VSLELKTARGPYRLSLATAPETLPDATLLTVSIERLDGIEKVALQYRVSSSVVGNFDIEEILRRLASWIERDFEMTRENALKSIRSERKLLVISFDESNRGPF
jgi:hypothetical protein